MLHSVNNSTSLKGAVPPFCRPLPMSASGRNASIHVPPIRTVLFLQGLAQIAQADAAG